MRIGASAQGGLLVPASPQKEIKRLLLYRLISCKGHERHVASELDAVCDAPLVLVAELIASGRTDFEL